MDKQAYLDQLAATSRPTPKKSRFLKSPIFKALILGLVGLIILLIIGAFIQNASLHQKNRLVALSSHLEHLSKSIKNYQPFVKSPALRSSSAALASIVANTSSDLRNILEKEHSTKDAKKANQSIEAKEKKLAKTRDEELFSAKINGILDRIYAHKMSYEISILTSRESEILHSSPSSLVKEALLSSKESLTNLYDDFNNFSEAD